MSKKKLVALALVVIMIATVSFSSLAWFTGKDEVTNKFLIAGSDNQNPDKIFSVDVWEDNDGDGKPDNDMGCWDEGLVYKDILPGDILAKDVHIKNTGSYDQYIRVIVVVTDASAWKEVLGTTDTPALGQIVNGLNYDKWTPNGANYDVKNDNFWYVLYGTNILEAGKDTSVFTEVKIPDSMTQEQAAKFAGGFQINVLAQAVQTENVGDSCYEAFKTVNLDAQTAYENFIAD